MQRTITIHSTTMVVRKYTLDVDIPEDADLKEWVIHEAENYDLIERLIDARRKEVDCDLTKMEVWDEAGQLLLRY